MIRTGQTARPGSAISRCSSTPAAIRPCRKCAWRRRRPCSSRCTNPDRKLALTLIARSLSPNLPIVVADDSDADVSWLPHAGASRVVLIDELVADAMVQDSLVEAPSCYLIPMLRCTIYHPCGW